MRILPILAAATAVAAIATPAMAQSPYPQPQQYQYPVPQQGYGYPQHGYPQQGYGQPQGIAGIINQMLGHNHNATDRHLVTQCATAAQAQASRQYRPARARTSNQPPHGNAYGYYAQQPMARVTAITNVNRTRNGLRVTGMMDSGMYSHHGAYGQPGYGQHSYHPAYANADLSFSCTVDRRGVVTGMRLNRVSQHRR